MLDRGSRVDRPRPTPIFILGKRLAASTVGPELAARLDAGLDLADDLEEQDTATTLWVSGGQTNPQVERTEAEAMAVYLTARGVDPSRIVQEGLARDTIGNAVFCRIQLDELADPLPRTAWVVSSRYHLPRAEYIFRQVLAPRVTLHGWGCDHPADPTTLKNEARSMELAKAFFAPLDPGDLPSILQRLGATHDLYDRAEISRAVDQVEPGPG